MKIIGFVETQSFWSRWLVLFLLFLIGTGVFAIFKEQEWDWEPFFGLGVIAIVIVFFTLSRLHTVLDDKGIYVDFKPFLWRKKWTWNEIGHVQIKKYSLMDYGGWGYRIGAEGTAYTMKGKYGFQIHFKNGEKILVGTQRPEDVQEFLNQLNHDQS